MFYFFLISTFLLNSIALANVLVTFFKEYFVKTSHNYSTRRNGLDIIVQKVSTETAKKGSYFLGAQVFNNLPSSMKETKSLFFIFKHCLRTFILKTLKIVDYCTYLSYFVLFIGPLMLF